MSARGQGALNGAMTGSKIGGPWGALVGGVAGLALGDKQQGQQDIAEMQDAIRKGQQDMADMRNGLEMDDDDRRLVAGSVDSGYGTFGGY